MPQSKRDPALRVDIKRSLCFFSGTRGHQEP